jgi:hypothetical protein
MLTEEWLTEEAEDQTVEYPAAADLWQVEQLLTELLAENEEAKR